MKLTYYDREFISRLFQKELLQFKDEVIGKYGISKFLFYDLKKFNAKRSKSDTFILSKLSISVSIELESSFLGKKLEKKVMPVYFPYEVREDQELSLIHI